MLRGINYEYNEVESQIVDLPIENNYYDVVSAPGVNELPAIKIQKQIQLQCVAT